MRALSPWFVLFAPFLAPLFSGCLGYHRGPLPDEPKTASFLELDGVRVRYLDVGKGPVVVLIHGFAASLDSWKTVIPALAERHRVLALDLKGFGWTDRPEGDYSPEAQARLVLDFMNARGVERAALVGHSWGASVALATALAAPTRVTRLALYDAWVYDDQVPMFFRWARAEGLGEALFSMFYDQRPDDRIALAFYDQRYVTQALVDEVESSLDRPGTRAAALAAVRGQDYLRLESRYRTIKQPALLLWGRDDTVTPLRYGERLSQDFPAARLLVYSRCGHFPMIEAVQESTRALSDFLAEDVP